MENIFDLEHQYQLYLKRAQLDESTMLPIQKQETKRAFMAACSQMVMLFTQDLPELEEIEALKVLGDLTNQCANFWIKESGMSN